MTYLHGIISSEKATSVAKPTAIDSAIGIVVGTAPINLIKDPYKAVNVPVLLSGYNEAIDKIGFSYDFKNFTICQSVYARFKKFFMSPLVVINVLDPNVHKSEVDAVNHNISNGKVELNEQGILLDKITVKSNDGNTTYLVNDDYIVSFTDEGTATITVIPDGAINGSSVKIGYTKIDPSKVTEADIIGGYDVASRKRSGIECINMVHPLLNIIPCQLLAPGWSHKPTVAAALIGKTRLINGLFNAIAITDIDTSIVTSIEDAEEFKVNNGYNDGYNLPCYPKVIVDGYEMYLSAFVDGVIASTDNANGGPYASPSNKSLHIDGICLESGEELFLDINEANILNGAGITTALKINEWMLWGNEMGCYPENTDTKDRFIVCRRVFNYQDNLFKINFFNKVDNPADYRLIEAIVNEENFILATLASQGRFAGGSISFSSEDNPVDKILDGHITFRRTLSPFTPAKVIETVTEFDPTLNSAALGGE